MNLSENDQHLNALFRAYRESVDHGDADPNFMPQLWERIDAKRSGSLLVRRVARIFATGAVGLAVLIGTAVSFSAPEQSDDTWVEVLANNKLSEVAADYTPIRLNESGNPSAAPARSPAK
jgi:hypothetical protein